MLGPRTIAFPLEERARRRGSVLLMKAEPVINTKSCSGRIYSQAESGKSPGHGFRYTTETDAAFVRNFSK